MASRAVHCLRLLCVGRNLGSGFVSAPSGRTAYQQRFFWGKLPFLSPSSPVSGGSWARGHSRHLYYSTSSGGDGGGDGEGDGRDDGEGVESREEEEAESEGVAEGEEEEKDGGLVGGVVHQQYALAPVAIPDVFPEVPVLPVSRNPIFPKFVKMLEVRVQII